MRRLLVAGAATLFVAVLVIVAAAVASEPILRSLGYDAASDRLVTGILVTGTAARPVVYVTSSDPRIGGAPTGKSTDLDTNSGVLSRLTWTASGWERLDLVRGLPRSRADHASNGMALDERRGVIYIAQGGNTNKGAPSSSFDLLPEYALSGAVLSVDLRRVGDRTYDLPTLDDDERGGASDDGDPFGGNGGKNQALLVPDGPVQVYAAGLRNPYDLVLTEDGRLYTVQNGAGAGWGDAPRACANEPQEGGKRDLDTLHLVVGGSFYGHANPTRGSRRNTFNRDSQSPVAIASPVSCRYLPPSRRQPLATFTASTNGIAEYSGDLLAVSLDGSLHRLSANRRQLLTRSLRAPLDVTAQGDEDVFPDTIWVAEYTAEGTLGGPGEGALTVLEPAGFEPTPSWQPVAPSGFERQEVSYVESGGKLYLAGGDTRHQAYDPATGRWSDVAPFPDRLDHMQGVTLNGLIYYIGGLEAWPSPEVATVYIYDPATDSFAQGAPMPRPRGAGAVVVHDGLIYYAGGLHDGSAVPWFDVYDPGSGRWEELLDMPRARDHFQAAVVGDTLYAVGGRARDLGTEIAETDAYDFGASAWRTGLAAIPTPRGGFAAATVGGELLVFGGEVEDRALATVEAYDPETDRWRAVEPMPTPRHGIQAAVCGGAVYIAAGGRMPGDAEPTDVHEVYVPTNRSGCHAETQRALTGVPFTASRVRGMSITRPTSLQFGPDGRLYVAQQDGLLKALTVVRRGRDDYVVVHEDTMGTIREIPNHDDDGSSATDFSSLVEAVFDEVGL